MSRGRGRSAAPERSQHNVLTCVTNTTKGKSMAQPAHTDGSTLVILSWDEGVSTNQTVNTVLVNPRFAGITLTGAYNHYSTLRLSEELLHLPLLAAAATVNDMMAELGLQ